MKRIILIALALICATSFQKLDSKESITSIQTLKVVESNSIPSKEETVYICTGSSSKRYHSNKKCKGLTNCGGAIKEMTKKEAEKMGRTPCKICCN